MLVQKNKVNRKWVKQKKRKMRTSSRLGICCHQIREKLNNPNSGPAFLRLPTFSVDDSSGRIPVANRLPSNHNRVRRHFAILLRRFSKRVREMNAGRVSSCCRKEERRVKESFRRAQWTCGGSCRVKETESTRQRIHHGETWSQAHGCKTSGLQLLLTDIEDGREEAFTIIILREDEQKSAAVGLFQAELSQFSLLGFSSWFTLKLDGILGGGQVLIMVVSGATQLYSGKDSGKSRLKYKLLSKLAATTASKLLR